MCCGFVVANPNHYCFTHEEVPTILVLTCPSDEIFSAHELTEQAILSVLNIHTKDFQQHFKSEYLAVKMLWMVLHVSNSLFLTIQLRFCHILSVKLCYRSTLRGAISAPDKPLKIFPKNRLLCVEYRIHCRCFHTSVLSLYPPFNAPIYIPNDVKDSRCYQVGQQRASELWRIA